MKIRMFAAVLLAASAILAACGKQAAQTPADPAPEEPAEEPGPAAENIPLEKDPVFGSTNAKISREEMESRISDINSKYSMYYTAELIIKGNTAATLLRMTDLLDDDDKKALMDSFKDDDPDASAPDYVLFWR